MSTPVLPDDASSVLPLSVRLWMVSAPPSVSLVALPLTLTTAASFSRLLPVSVSVPPSTVTVCAATGLLTLLAPMDVKVPLPSSALTVPLSRL